MSFFDTLDRRYRLILCDVWGVVHDGVSLYPGAAQRLRGWRADNRCVVLLTNAPRTEKAVEQQLARIGLPNDAYDFVATSGEAGIQALHGLNRPVGFIGSVEDRAILEERGVRIAPDADFRDLACTGTTRDRPQPDDYRPDLERWSAARVVMHCLNPDRLVIRGGVAEACAGAIADIYERLGGKVIWYGKPHAAIYHYALDRAGNPPHNAILAIGDGLQTDVLGAARMGFDTVFVTGGIHDGQPYPATFASDNGLGHWAPVEVVGGLL